MCLGVKLAALMKKTGGETFCDMNSPGGEDSPGRKSLEVVTNRSACRSPSMTAQCRWEGALHGIVEDVSRRSARECGWDVGPVGARGKDTHGERTRACIP